MTPINQTLHVTSDRAWQPDPYFGDDLPHGTVVRGVQVLPTPHQTERPAPKPGTRSHVGIHPDITSYWEAPDAED